MPISLYQSNFTSGVLHPKLAVRTDIAQHANGLKRGDNVVVMPYGGFRRRGGLKHITTVPGTGVLAQFSFNSSDQQYLLIFVDQRVYFIRNGSLITNINGGGNDYLVTPYVAADLRLLRWTQAADTMILVHEDYAPRTLVRGATDATWTLSTITFETVPQVDFNDSSSPTPTSEIQTVTFTSFATGNLFKLDLEGVTTENITYDATNTDETAERIGIAVGALYNTGSGDVVCTYTSGTSYEIEFQNGAARAYSIMTGYSTTGSGTVGVVRTQVGVPRTENVWSATRGWPRSVCFYEGRLVFGGSTHRPVSIWLSRTNALYNFDTGEALDDDAIFRTLDTDQLNAINGVLPGRHLTVYTSGGNFFSPDLPMTPQNSNFRPQDLHGSFAVRQFIEPEGAAVFVDKTGKGVYLFVYSDGEAAYSATSTSRIASHLIKTPVDMCQQDPAGDDDTNFIYVVNTDGTLAVLNLLRSEGVQAWTSFSTQGSFVSCAALTDTAYFLVSRDNGFHVEQLDESYYLDDAEKVSGSAQTAWSVSTRLNGVACRLRGDGAVLSDVTPASGAITSSAAVDEIEIGRWFAPLAETMPMSIATQSGMFALGKARIVEMAVAYHESVAVRVNGQYSPEMQMDVSTFDISPTPFTGVPSDDVGHPGGHGRLVSITFDQEVPMPMTVLGVQYTVEV